MLDKKKNILFQKIEITPKRLEICIHNNNNKSVTI
jgi:hypothetical protein